MGPRGGGSRILFCHGSRAAFPMKHDHWTIPIQYAGLVSSLGCPTNSPHLGTTSPMVPPPLYLLTNHFLAETPMVGEVNEWRRTTPPFRLNPVIGARTADRTQSYDMLGRGLSARYICMVVII